jgi:nucleoside-diphosphate-sugar epimerase
MAILITGGAGYVGRWLARELVSRQIEAVVFDRLAPDPASPLGVPPTMRFAQGDVADRDAVLAAARLTPFDAIVHLAGIVTMGSERDPDLAMRVNLGGTHNVLEAARQAGVPRVVFASTILVYGPDVPQPITEAAPAEPVSWYGQTKVLAESLGRFYERRYGVAFRVARLAAVVGPFASPPPARRRCTPR